MPAARPGGQDGPMPWPRISLASILVSATLAGCPTEGAEDPPPDSHDWFVGTVTATKPDGDPLSDPSVSLMRRSTLPGQERIEEQVVELDTDGFAFEVIASLTVVAEDSTFRTQYQDEFGVLEGFGSFTDGPDWAWTAWDSQVEYTSGSLLGTSVQSVGALDGGAVSIETQVIGADSVLEVIEIRELSAVSESDFDAEYNALLGD